MTTPPISPALAARLAHEVRSPLSVLTGTLDQLARDDGLSPVSAQLLKLARRSCDRMMRLARRLEAIAAEAPREGQPVGLDAMGRWVERAAHDAARSSVEVEVGALPASVELSGPAACALEVAVDEVVHNAVRHAKARVELDVQLFEGRLRLVVCDDGSGLPPSLVGRAPAVQTGTRGGLGLGLALAHTYVLAVDGALDIQSDRVVIEVPTS